MVVYDKERELRNLNVDKRLEKQYNHVKIGDCMACVLNNLLIFFLSSTFLVAVGSLVSKLTLYA